MKKLTKILITSLILLLSSLCFTQTTTVTLQVTDTPDGQTWNNGSWRVQLLPLTNNISISSLKITTTGQSVPNPIQSGMLNGTGGASVTVTPTTAITPMGTQWTFTVCPFATSPCYSQNYIIYGTTQNITINPPSIRIGNPNIILSKTYGDFEIIPSPGMIWLDVTANQPRYVNALSIIQALSGGGGGNPGGAVGQVQYNNSGAFGGFTFSGDCTLVVATGVITCTSTNGTLFGTAATANLSSYSSFPFQSITTLGTTGPATLINGVLNIPQYITNNGTVNTSFAGYFGYYATNGTVISGDTNLQDIGTAIALTEPETINVPGAPTLVITAQISANTLPVPASGYSLFEADSTGALGENINPSGTATGWFPFLTANNTSTQIQSLTNCNIANYVYSPQANNCVPVVNSFGPSGSPRSGAVIASNNDYLISQITPAIVYGPATGGISAAQMQGYCLGESTVWVPSGTFNINLSSASLPSTAYGCHVDIINYGSGILTIVPSGVNLNGTVANVNIPASSASAPSGAHLIFDGANFEVVLWTSNSYTLPTQYTKGFCSEVWGGTATSNVLQATDDYIANNSCFNDSGVPRTITAVKCRSDYVSSTITVNPTMGAAGTGTTIGNGTPLTCGSSLAYSSSITLTNTSWLTGTGITPVMGSIDTHSTSIVMIVEYTY